MRKGYSALQSGNYEQAESYFNRAIVKDKSRAEAYTGLSEIYIEQNDLDSAESVFLSALETQPTNADLYQAAIDFYVDTEQLDKISPLLADCEDETVLNKVSDYVSAAPTFSLEGGTYTEVQEVTISSSTGERSIIQQMEQILLHPARNIRSRYFCRMKAKWKLTQLQ